MQEILKFQQNLIIEMQDMNQVCWILDSRMDNNFTCGLLHWKHGKFALHFWFLKKHKQSHLF